ncbi:MAG TPA: ABC transporter permease [Steroidobacteraceae bacterium]|nr:ABC transporter permease [Steroidobacteraceae bacterium]
MRSTLTALRALVRKDVAIFLRDRRALVVSVLTPIVVAAFFGSLFGGGGAGDNVSKVPVGVTDLDGSTLSRAVVEALAHDESLATDLMPEGDAHQLVKTGKLRAAVVIPAGFGAAAPAALLGRAEKPSIKLFYDPSQSVVRSVLAGIVTQHVMQEVTRPFTSGKGVSSPFTIASQAVSTGPRYNGYAHSFAGMSVQFTLFMGIDAGVALLLMRETGMWRRLRAAPLSRGVLLGSRVAATTLIAMLILTVVYAAAIAVFGVRIAGSFAGFAMIAFAFAVLAATTGLMIAAIGGTVAATRGVATFSILILVMLGGAWVPAFLFPEWLQNASKILPTRWAVDGFDAMTWRGLPLASAFAPVAVLLAWSALFALIAVWRFDWEGD